MESEPRVKGYFKKYTQQEREEITATLQEWYFGPRGIDVSDPIGWEREGEPHVISRYRFTCNRWVPWISRFVDINPEETVVVEIGSGTGSLISGFGHVAKEVHGFDIDMPSNEAARGRAKALGQTNVHCHCHSPDEIIEAIRRDSPDRVDIVSLYATLEHQTYEERQRTLEVAWDIVREGGVVVIGQTPNLLSYYHPHTSNMSFFDMLPDDIKMRYLDVAPETNFVKRMRTFRDDPAQNSALALTRWGRGVSYHDFEIAYGDLSRFVVGHGFESEILSFNPVTLEERLLLTYLSEREPKVPLGFARRWLTMVLQKPTKDSGAPSLPRDQSIIDEFAFKV